MNLLGEESRSAVIPVSRTPITQVDESWAEELIKDELDFFEEDEHIILEEKSSSLFDCHDNNFVKDCFTSRVKKKSGALNSELSAIQKQVMAHKVNNAANSGLKRCSKQGWFPWLFNFWK